jgi:hypothetical protein
MSDLDLLDLHGWQTLARSTVGEGDLEVQAEPVCKQIACPHRGTVRELVKFGFKLRTIHDIPHGDLPRVLGLDEVYIGKHARAVMTNVEAGTVVYLLEDRKDRFLANCIHDRGNARAAFQIVVTDMSTTARVAREGLLLPRPPQNRTRQSLVIRLKP